ncbi:TRAP transporter substrate-binding protein [Ruania zhangjianzhongii]|uniref:TRAP transporter substrate-binding protein n=1 Tax=Ruania zhangjianzhongii TaxID=2603206 RepID=UPI0011C848A2|nr:TRAP transporter substrate-binding protein [Ruania zhangjianzhongii]
MTRKKAFAVAVTTASVALGLAACGSGDSGGGGGDAGSCDPETTWRLAFNQTEEHPQYQAGVQLGEDLCEATDGRYGIEVYANELLGTQSDVINNVSDGSVEMMWVGAPVLESLNPDFIVFNLPYMFDSQEAQADVLGDEEVIGDLYSSLEDSEGISVLAGVYSGVRNVYNASQPIVEPEDLSGLKLRVQQSDSQVRMIEMMGAVASPMGQGEVYTALQSGVLDGAENNETVYNALKHDEVAPYYSYTRHLMIPDYLLISSTALDGMSDEDRQALTDLIPGVVEQANSGFITYAEESRAASEEAGAEFNDDVNIEAFREAVQPLIDESINNDVRQGLFDAVQAANEEFPASSGS